MTHRTHRRSRPPERLLLIFVAAWATLSTQGAAPDAWAAQEFDLVIAAGRAMDPETGLDAVRYVGVNDGRIAAISSQPLVGDEQIDGRGLVISPGFVDLHAHGQSMEANRFQAMDGVTTALELEGGVFPVAQWYRSREGQALIHYGATVSHGQVRSQLLSASGSGGIGDFASETNYRPVPDARLGEMDALLEQGLGEGALGIGYGINYTPGASRQEIWSAFSTAARKGATNFVHVRFAGLREPGSSIEAIQEMIANAGSTGASVHIVHIGSSGLTQAPLILKMLEGARGRGLDITTEVYPYTAASTAIESAIFDDGWRENFGVDYDAIEWVLTGERLNASNFEAYRTKGGIIIAHIMQEDIVDQLVADPNVLIASDGVWWIENRAHPRSAGTFARVLGRYVREKRALSLMEALRKMTIMPARRMESYAEAFKRKGRLQEGADADMVVFDPATVIDKATFAEPAQFSEGIRFVMVGGTLVVKDGELVEGVAPGKAIRAR